MSGVGTGDLDSLHIRNLSKNRQIPVDSFNWFQRVAVSDSTSSVSHLAKVER